MYEAKVHTPIKEVEKKQLQEAFTSPGIYRACPIFLIEISVLTVLSLSLLVPLT